MILGASLDSSGARSPRPRGRKLGHLDVHEHDVVLALEGIEHLAPVFDDVGVVAEPSEQRESQLPIDRIVLGHQQTQVDHGGSQLLPGSRRKPVPCGGEH